MHHKPPVAAVGSVDAGAQSQDPGLGLAAGLRRDCRVFADLLQPLCMVLCIAAHAVGAAVGRGFVGALHRQNIIALRGVQNKAAVRLVISLIGIAGQAGQHGAVLHIVPVHKVVEIRKIGAAAIIQKQASVVVLCAAGQVRKIIVVVRRLQDGIIDAAIMSAIVQSSPNRC